MIFKCIKKTLFVFGLMSFVSAHASNQIYDVESFGNFSRMIQTGNAPANIQLNLLSIDKGTWGVGALAGLQGEIVQIDGQIFVTPGTDVQGHTRLINQQDAATLWVSANVENWQQVFVPSNMTQQQFETFFQQQAKRYHLDLKRPFAVRITGGFINLIWHVQAGINHPELHASPSVQHAHSFSKMRKFQYEEATGQLVGVYSGDALEGIVSHPGQRLHLHYINDDLTISGHVEKYNIKAGALLWLPKMQ